MLVLVIDDEPLMRRSLRRALELKGHEVLEAEDGVVGLKKWQDHHPDLVFLDVIMPGKTGPQVLREIGNFGRTKVILMSAHRGDHGLGPGPGANLFLSKPFEDILKTVETAERLVNE